MELMPYKRKCWESVFFIRNKQIFIDFVRSIPCLLLNEPLVNVTKSIQINLQKEWTNEHVTLMCVRSSPRW